MFENKIIFKNSIYVYRINFCRCFSALLHWNFLMQKAKCYPIFKEIAALFVDLNNNSTIKVTSYS